MSTSIHTIRCKRTGKGLGTLQGGGSCACPDADHCREPDDDVSTKPLPSPAERGYLRLFPGSVCRCPSMEEFDGSYWCCGETVRMHYPADAADVTPARTADYEFINEDMT